MGFLDFLFGKEKEKENIQSDNSPFNTTFVNEKEEIDFEESIYGKIQLYSTDIPYIKEVLPERGIELEKQIDALTKLLELTNDERDLEVKIAFVEFELLFEKTKRMADGEYTLRQLNKQNKEMDKNFETEFNIDKAQIDEYISYISKINEKVNDGDNTDRPLFTNVQRQRFNKIAMQSEYRLKMLELMHLLTKGMKSEVTVNPFKDLSITKQKIFSQLFLDDVKAAQKQYSSLAEVEQAFANDGQSFDSIDRMAKKITDQLAEASMVEDFSISQLFDSKNQSLDSFNFLKEFVEFKRDLNEFMKNKEKVIERYNFKQEIERRVKEEYAERLGREQERKEKLKNMQNSEINDEIYKIEHDLSAKGNRFINILEFQKKVAREKGLLDSESTIQKGDLSYYEVEACELPDLIQNANKAGVNYMIIPDAQERYKNFKFIISTSDSDIAEKLLHNNEENLSSNRNFFQEEENLGDYPAIISRSLIDKFKKDKNSFYMDNFLCMSKLYNGNYSIERGFKNNCCRDQESKKTAKLLIDEYFQKIYDELEDQYSSEEYYQNMLCYFRVPITRNIIPILQEFKNHGVTAFLEPVPNSESNRNQQNREFIHIYFQREDLDKVRKDIEPVISNSKVGVAPLHRDKCNLGEEIRDNIEWPVEVVRDR